MKLNISYHIKEIVPYPPGKPLEELERELGITGPIKLASNENPWGPSPKAVEAIAKNLSNIHRYPDGSGYYLTEAIAEKVGVSPTEIVLGNGSNEIIEFLVKAFIRSGDEVITSHPSFLMYQKFVQVRGGENIVIPLRELSHNLDAIQKAVTNRTRLIFLDNPNNPRGTIVPRKEFNDFLSHLPEEVVVVLDEAYVDFMRPEDRIDIHSLIRIPENIPAVVSLRTFSKAYGLAGLRVGFGIMHPEIAQILHRVRQPFNINLLGQIGALASLSDDEHYNKTIQGTREGKEWLTGKIESLGLTVFPSHANFFLIDIFNDASVLYEAMLRKGVIVRAMKAYGFPNLIRLTVGNKEENQRFFTAFEQCLKELNYV
ncbi:MAG: histidinol-phosphate transaminase [Desulfobulbaceae bacterium]|nr:histidinol-phosphate transaminase [Desulfobulbaceae bacterium]